MSFNIIDGKQVAQEYRQKLRERINKLELAKIVPGFAVILVGDHPASVTYVKNLEKACHEIKIICNVYHLEESVSQEQVLALIDKLNADKNTHGIIIQLPLPQHLDAPAVVKRLDPEKDVDALHRQNLGSIMVGDFTHVPCTAASIVALIKSTGQPILGKDCVIVGRSNIVGRPLSMIMVSEDATVTLCHSKTENLTEHCIHADILVAAVGIPRFITGDMIKPGGIVIDVGTNRDENGVFCGDVDFDTAKEKAAYITPVPGGVGPMTITMLIGNVVSSAENSSK